MTPRARAISQAVGVAAAIVVAVLANLVAARHYRRWDWTREGLYTLSRTTEETLSSLPEPVEVWVLSADSEPITLTLRHLLTAYRAKTDRLVVHFIDPDRNPAELLAAQQKLGIATGRVEGGHVITDSIAVITRGERRHYVAESDLMRVEQGDELRVQPKIEEVLTAGLREVIAGEPVEVCFTAGHGEPSLEAGGEDGLLPLASRLTKFNFKVVPLPNLTDLDGKDPIGACALVVLAAPQQRLPKDEVRRLELYLEGGGNLLLSAGPVADDVHRGFVALGVEPLYAAAGLVLRHDMVFELDADRRAGAAGHGEMFLVKPAQHAVTAGLRIGGDPVPVVVDQASSLEVAPNAVAKPSALLTTSAEAVGITDLYGLGSNEKALEPGPNDTRGPLTVAYAVELPKKKAAAQHGPRVVALGSQQFLAGRNWTTPPLRGAAWLVEAAVSWLAAKNVTLDIPAKQARPVGLNLTQAALRTVLIGVVMVVPLTVLFAGVAVRWRRQRTEEQSRRSAPKGPKERKEPEEPKDPKEPMEPKRRKRARRKPAEEGDA